MRILWVFCEFDEQEIKGMIKTLAHENPKYQFDEDGKVRHHEDKAASAKAIKEHEGAVAAANVVAVGAEVAMRMGAAECEECWWRASLKMCRCQRCLRGGSWARTACSRFTLQR